MAFKPSFLERALLSVAPSYGLNRLRSRLAAEQVLRAYDGAAMDRRTNSWKATGASINVENGTAIDTLRFRARDMERNNKHVASAIQQFAGKVVSTGITPRPVSSSARTRQWAMDAWNRHADECDSEGQIDAYGQQSLTARGIIRDGESLILWLPDGNGPNGKTRVIEPDYLDSSRIRPNYEGNIVFSGIEYAPTGARVGYWLFEAHPGDNSLRPRRGAPSKFTPASDVDHFFQPLRSEQARGVSWFAPVMLAMRGLDDINEAMIWRKRMEACIGIVTQSPEGQGSVPILGEQKKASGGQLQEVFRPGMNIRLGPGETVQAFTPSSSGDTMDYVRSQLYAFSAVTGIPYHNITGDVERANYSSLRAAELAGNIVLDMVQWLVYVPRLKRQWRRVMQREALLTGRTQLLGCSSAWSVPVRPWVDPVKEVTAKYLEIRAGLQSMPDAMAERGLDWLAQLDEIEQFLKVCDAKGIILATDARKVAESGTLQAIAMQQDQTQNPTN